MGGIGEMVGMVSQVAGMMGGGGGGGGAPKPKPITFDATAYANKANSFLDKALESAIDYSEEFTDRARQEAKLGDEISQARNAPYRLASYNGLDKYLESIGMARPKMGSYKLANALEREADRNFALDQLSLLAGDIQSEYPNLYGTTLQVGDPKKAGAPYNPYPTLEDQKRFIAKGYGEYAYDPATMDPTYGPHLENYAITSAPIQGGYNIRTPQQYVEYFAGMTPALLGEGRWSSGGVIPQEDEKALKKMSKQAREGLIAYDDAMRYWLPEHSGIAKGFNQGLLSAPQWVEVGGDNYYG